MTTAPTTPYLVLRHSPTFPKVDAYFVDCSTGCSCCRGENHERGPFSSREVADARVEQYRALPLLASQYAPRGNYSVYCREAEVLPDGRLIVDSRVYAGMRDDTVSGGDEERCNNDE